MVDSLEDYVRALENREFVSIAYVASGAVLVYDLILTLYLEIPLVWFSRWNYTKALYLLARYIPFVANTMILCNLLLPGASGSTCANTFKTAGWLYFVGLDLAEAILVIRTWACWGRNKWVGIGLASWMLLCQIPSGIFMHKFLDSLRFGSVLANSESNSCFVVSSNRLLWGDWLVLLVGEGVTLTLMAIFVYRTFRDGDNTPLVKLIRRDGLTFYAYLFCATSINIALTLALDDVFVAIVSPSQSAIHSALTTRIILNIREAASRRSDDFSIDLHLSDIDFRLSVSRVSFAENPDVSHSGGDPESGTSQREEGSGSVGTTRTGMMSINTSATISHVTLPVTRNDKGKRVADRLESGDEEDSIHNPLDEWV